MAININTSGPPVPVQSPLVTDTGLIENIWLMFFKGVELANTAFFVVADTGLALTDAYQDVPDCSIVLALPGVWLVVGVFDFQLIGPAENGAIGGLDINGDVQLGWARLGNDAGFGSGTAVQFWVFKNVATSVTNPTVAKLVAKTAVAGSGHVNPDSTKLIAIFLRPS